ncbi:MAG TPA: M56 family metallopeptidase, partial [Planctomycetaceae bacterium]|nr:M56 family metallopeptidase [Planctomycetaceae bacterium]
MFSMVASLFLKVTMMLAAALLVDALLRRRWVLVTATLWNAVLIALLVLPLATLLAPPLKLPLLPVDSSQASAVIVASRSGAESSRSIPANDRARDLDGADSGEPSAAISPSTNNGMLLLVLAGIYGLGVVALLARLLAGWHAAKALCDQAALVTNTRWLDRLEFWMSGRSRRVKLLHSDQIDVPIALGVRKPVILIPSSLVSRATSRTVDSILIHELAHVYRADCAWQLVDRIVQAALWLHPLMWIAQRRIAFIRERACDDFAVHRVGDFRAYGETLLDIAAGIRHRRAARLGLTIARSSQLARRLSAISQSAGSNRYVAAPSARWSLMTATLCGAIGLGSLAVDRAAEKEPPVSTTPPTNALPANVSPELIAVTWQQLPESNNKRIEQPVWRPNGKRLTDAEANALLDQVKSFQTHWWNKEETLRPLVLVYRRPPGIHTGLMTSIVLPNGRRMGTGSWMYSLANGLAKSSCSPQRADLRSWPAKVDLDVK